MQVGVPKEIKDHEYRVSITPDGVRVLRAHGHNIWVESSAGLGSGFTDQEYLAAGAQIAQSKQQVFDQAELIVKVKEPLLEECNFFHPKQTLFTFLHIAALPELTKRFLEKDIIAIAYETTTEGTRLPMLQPMSEIAGRMAVQVGAQYLERTYGGAGVLLSGVPGVSPGKVVILGAGSVGSSAIRMAVGLGAQVTVLNLELERLRELDAIYQGRIQTLASHQPWIDREVLDADLVIGAVLLPGAKAPKLVSRQIVSQMKPGSVVVDVSVDQGGCFETTQVTTHSDPIVTVDGVLHYGVANMPGIVPRTSTFALTNATLPFIVHIASAGVKQAIQSDPGLAKGVNIHSGQVVCREVAEAHGMAYVPLADVLS